jgi:hypothetical protein
MACPGRVAATSGDLMMRVRQFSYILEMFQKWGQRHSKIEDCVAPLDGRIGN